MKYCPFCGSGLDDEMIFCPKCGKRFRGAHENAEDEEFATEVSATQAKETATNQTINEKKFASPASQKKSKKPLIFGIVIAAFILIAAFSCALFFYGKNDDSGDNSNIPDSTNTVEDNATDDASDDENDVSTAAKSVLLLEAYDDDNNLVATASGFITLNGTTLVTNYHVIDGAYYIVATTPDGSTSVGAKKILAYDEVLDLAVLECESDIGVMPLALGNSDMIVQGDAVFAVGYPLGLAHTLSDGVVSSRYTDANGTDTLQITAAISSGSSGGALFNEVGEVIGIICASYVEGQNLNIAIATNELSHLLNFNHNPVQLAEYYIANSTYGATQANLAGGCVFTENDKFRFYEKSEYITQIDKTTGELSTIAYGDCINLYKNKLYYRDDDTNDIVQYDTVSKTFTYLNLFSGETTDDYFYKESVSNMLVAEDKMFLLVSFVPSGYISDWYHRLMVVDINDPSTILYFSDFNITDFTYCQSTLFVGVEDNQILALNMKTLSEQFLDIPCNASFEGADDNYFYFTNGDSYGYKDRNLYRGSLMNFERNTAVDKIRFVDTAGQYTFLDYCIYDNQVYCLMTCYEGEITADTEEKRYFGKYNATGKTEWETISEAFSFHSIGVCDGVIYDCGNSTIFNPMTSETHSGRLSFLLAINPWRNGLSFDE